MIIQSCSEMPLNTNVRRVRSRISCINHAQLSFALFKFLRFVVIAISREFDSPSHFFQSEEREPAGRGRGMETGLPGYAAETLFRNAKSNATRVLYQSPITAFEPSIASFRSLNPSQFNFSATSSLPSQNTELIYRRRLQDSSASKVEISTKKTPFILGTRSFVNFSNRNVCVLNSIF